MRPSQMVKFLTDRYKAGVKRPVHIESVPGSGKTEIAKRVSEILGIGSIVLHAPLLQPEDYGFPVITGSRDDVDFIVSKSKFPIVGAPCPDSGILLIDELPQADASAQKILANLAQEREIHGHKLKDGWMIVSTGNRTVDKAGANRLLSHLRNKITTVELEVSLDDWVSWALDNGIKTELIAFLRFRPDLLAAFDPQQELNPTPRAWSQGVNQSLGTVDTDVEFQVYKGDVGEGAAAELLGFLKIFRTLPSIDSIILNPAGTQVPSDPATLYALCAALASKTTETNFSKVMVYVKRMPREFSVLYVREVIRRAPSVQTTKDFIAWATSDGKDLLT